MATEKEIGSIMLNNIALDEPCDACKQSGAVHNPNWLAWFRDHKESPPLNHALWREPEEFYCEECEGVGFRPTDAGESILKLVLRYLHMEMK